MINSSISEQDYEEYLKLIKQGMSQRSTCDVLSLSRSSIQRYLKKLNELNSDVGTTNTITVIDDKVNVLFLDLESSLMEGMFFRIWQENIQFKRITKQSHLLTASWAFNDEPVQGVRVTPNDVATSNDFDIVVKMVQAINKADIIVTFNGKKFDCKLLNTRALFWGLPPIKPVKHIDLFEQSKRLFKFPSNSMQNISMYLGENGKLATSSDLWERCANHKNYDECDKALDEMLRYNQIDIEATRDLFYRYQGRMKGVPNIATITNDKKSTEHLRCTHCGGLDVDKMNEKTYTTASSFNLYRCSYCKGISRVTKNGKMLVGVI